MNIDLIQKLQYSFVGQDEAHSLPLPLKDSLQLISTFFKRNNSNKLCLVFPSKEYSAQWLSIPVVLQLIENDYKSFGSEIFEKYKLFKVGDKLILNDYAIVEFSGVASNGISFKTKAGKECSGAEITISLSQIFKLKLCDQNRKLSSFQRVKEVLPKKIISPIDKLLDFKTFGSNEFIKNKVCLVSKYKSFDDSIENIVLNFAMIQEFFQVGKIDENGTASTNSPLLLANNLSNLALYSIANPITKIIIDGFSVIQERGTDFSDIDVKNIPTILITDLSEIESFEFIGNFGFEFFNFTKENLSLDQQLDNSPFNAFSEKLKKYLHFNIVKEICKNSDLETITQKIHSIEKDDSNNEMNTLKVNLIQLTNHVSRICHFPSPDEINSLNQKLNTIENLFLRTRMWLGDSNKPIEESITLLKSVIEKLIFQPTEKCERLKSLISQTNYDYIICPSEIEAQALKTSLHADTQAQVISVADVNDNLLTNKKIKAIITGWAKSNNINRILSSFLFSELTVLFYQFENKYFNSLQRRNRKYHENIKSTINRSGIHSSVDIEKPKGFDDFYSFDEVAQATSEISFDIFEFELKLDNSQYSKYRTNGNLIECIKAKRVDFENDLFIYSSESHKFLVINELIEKRVENAKLYRKKLEALKPGDVILLINTDRDILAELVERNTNNHDLVSVKRWTDLWKNLLKEHFAVTGEDFKKLVEELRKNDCKKHEGTIRAWLQDENRIGPNDDSDLICIAIVANSKELLDNIPKVRESISKMVGWRMQASDYISNQIKTQIHKIVDKSLINSKVEIEGLGSVTILKTINISNYWEEIDVRYVNKLLEKEPL